MRTLPIDDWDTQVMVTRPSELFANEELTRAVENDVQHKAAWARLAMIHPDDMVPPADLVPHKTPTGDPVHEAGWWVCGWPLAILAVISVVAIIAWG